MGAIRRTNYLMWFLMYCIAVLAELAAVPLNAFDSVQDDVGSRFRAKHSNLNYWLLGLLAGVVITAWVGLTV